MSMYMDEHFAEAGRDDPDEVLFATPCDACGALPGLHRDGLCPLTRRTLHQWHADLIRDEGGSE